MKSSYHDYKVKMYKKNSTYIMSFIYQKIQLDNYNKNIHNREQTLDTHFTKQLKIRELSKYHDLFKRKDLSLRRINKIAQAFIAGFNKNEIKAKRLNEKMDDLDKFIMNEFKKFLSNRIEKKIPLLIPLQTKKCKFEKFEEYRINQYIKNRNKALKNPRKKDPIKVFMESQRSLFFKDFKNQSKNHNDFMIFLNKKLDKIKELSLKYEKTKNKKYLEEIEKLKNNL